MTRSLNNRIAGFLAILVTVTMMISSAQADEVDISVPQNRLDPVLMQVPDGVVDLSEATVSEVLKVFVGTDDQCCAGRTPVAGTYTINGATLSFQSAFGFEPVQNYIVRIQLPGEVESFLPFMVTTHARRADAAVTDFFPSGETLPENVLRFYLHFSAPMQPHVAFDYIQLRDSNGRVDDAAFMRFKQELWNEDRTRLTILMDPGRIKREVATNRELGPALVAGQRYTLSVDSGWPAADGTSFIPAFERSFQITDALRTGPDTGLWRSNSPCLGTAEPLQITFDRPFDRHLLANNLHVVTETGRAIAGSIKVGNGERSWRFSPDQTWPQEDLRVVANTGLEDVAGNNFRDLLDHVVGTESADAASSELSITLSNCKD